jgi:hypothetical protein
MSEPDADGRVAERAFGALQKRLAQLFPAARREQESFAVWPTMRKQIVHPL